MTISSNDSFNSPIKTSQAIEPLSTRTQRRLQSMGRFTRRVANSSIGYDERSLAAEASVTAMGNYLVAILRDRERTQ